MTGRRHQRHGRVRGFLGSALIHAGLIALVVLGVRDQGRPGTQGGGQPVAVNLDMFETASASVVNSEPPAPTEPTTEPVPETEPEPEPVAEAEPQPEPAAEPEPEPEPVAEPEPKPQPKPEPKPEPKPKPKPEPKPKPKPKPVPRPEPKTQPLPPAAPSENPQPAAAQTKADSERPAAERAGDTADAGRASAPGLFDIATLENNYLDGLRRAIERNRYYPRKAHRRGREGQVLVSFVLQADGRITDIRVSERSKWRELDKAAVDALERLGRYDPIPATFGRERWALRVPINFALK